MTGCCRVGGLVRTVDFTGYVPSTNSRAEMPLALMTARLRVEARGWGEIASLKDHVHGLTVR